MWEKFVACTAFVIYFLGERLGIHKNLFCSVAFVGIMACSQSAFAHDTTTFSVNLNDGTKTGTFSIDQNSLGDGTTSITAATGGNVYNYAYQYFTPAVSGAYVFGQLQAPSDTVILLYTPAFSDASANINFVELSDDGDPSSIGDAALRTYVTNQISARSCGGSDGLCPLLSSTLTAGVDYYVVVSTYRPGDSLGTSSDSVAFFVIGDALVGVGGVPPAVPTSGYVSVASPSPVSGLASYLDGYDNSGQLASVASYLDTASEGEVLTALKTIFPVNTSFAPESVRNATGQTATVLIDKVGTVLGGLNTPDSTSFANGTFSTGKWIFGSGQSNNNQSLFASFSQDRGYPGGADDIVTNLSSVPYQKYGTDGRAFWIQGVGGLTNAKADAATNGYDSTSAGVVSGYEFGLNEDNLVGLIASAFRSNVELDNNAGETDANTYSVGVYGQHLFGSVKLTGVFLTSYSDYDSKRNVNVGGVTGTPEADYNGWGTSTTISASKLLEHEGAKIEPFVTANYTTASTDGYAENGDGVYNMNVSSDTSSTASAKTGVTVQHDFTLSDMVLELKAKPYVGYQWELNEASNAVRISGGSTSVTIAGRDANKGQVGFAVEGNLKISQSDSFKLGVDYSHDKDEDSALAYIGYGLKF